MGQRIITAFIVASIVFGLWSAYGGVMATSHGTARLLGHHAAQVAYADDPPTDTPTDVPTDTPTDVPTDTPTDVPTDTPTDVPTDTSTPTPDAQQTATEQAGETQTAQAQATITAMAAAWQTLVAGRTATMTALQTVITANQTAYPKTATAIAQTAAAQTASAQQTLAPQQTAAAAAQQTAAAAAAQQTAVAAAAQQTAAAAAAQQTAVAQGAATTAAQQTAVAQTASAVAQLPSGQQTSAAQTAAAAQQTSAAQTATAVAQLPPGQQTSVAQVVASATAQQNASTSSAGAVVASPTSNVIVVTSSSKAQQFSSTQSSSLMTATTPVTATGSTSGGQTVSPSSSQSNGTASATGGSPSSSTTASTSASRNKGAASGKKAARRSNAGPRLSVTLLTSLVRPGDVQRIAISYVPSALVQTTVTFPKQHPRSFYNRTDRHGRLTVAVTVPKNVPMSRGRAQALVHVRAVAGPLQQLEVLAPVLHAGTAEHVTLAYAPQTFVQVALSVAGQRPVSFYNMTDQQGHLSLAISAPKNAPWQHGQTTGRMTVWTVASTYHAEASVMLNVSDMIVSVTVSSIANCLQAQVIHVAYRPNTALHVLLLLPHGRHVPFTAATDGHGQAAVPFTLRYVRADNPLFVGVQVTDTSQARNRVERITYRLSLPPPCRKPSAGGSGSPKG